MRVVITGMGIVSCIGNDLNTVAENLRHSRSGIRYACEHEELGLKSRVAGVPDVSGEPAIDRKLRRFMGDASIYAYHAMRKAIEDAEIAAQDISSARTALIVGSGVGSPYRHHDALEIFKTKGLDKLLPYYVPQIMGSTTSANLTHAFNVGGPSYSITAACATSAHCIGNAFDLIRHGVVDRAFVGGSEEVCWPMTVLFDSMGALSTRWNHQPQAASRPFDIDRDGFVIGGGAGILLLESEESARRRGANIYGEVAGYGAASEASDMVQPDVRGASRAMLAALASAGNPAIDYINPHATSTPLGDRAELDAIRSVFDGGIPALSATKALTGHSIGACGAHEAIFCMLMMRHGFVAGSANLAELDPGYAGIPVVRETMQKKIDVCLSNSIGFGGTNASLVLARI